MTRGAAHIAMRAERDLVPVTILCEPARLYGGLPWWDVPDRAFSVTLIAGEPIPIEEVLAETMSRSRAARDVTGILRDHFERQLALVQDPGTS